MCPPTLIDQVQAVFHIFILCATSLALSFFRFGLDPLGDALLETISSRVRFMTANSKALSRQNVHRAHRQNTKSKCTKFNMIYYIKFRNQRIIINTFEPRQGGSEQCHHFSPPY